MGSILTLVAGQKLGPYEIIEPAGAGGMGEIFKARDTRLDRTVAIKVLPSHLALNADTRARFERESKTISSLNHPNVCTLHDVGHESGVDFLVMEFLEGEPLDERIKRGRFETNKILQIGAQIAGALDAAHKKGLVHRDLKPSNVFLTKEGAKLLDFGLAKLQTDAVAGMDNDTRTTPVTGAGTIVGTLQYMSPEQLEGQEADARSDIFSFGATLYEMVTGKRAFTGDSKASLIGSIMQGKPSAISELQPTFPPALDRLIMKCLQKDQENRWQTAKDLQDELAWIASAGSQAGIPKPVASHRRIRMRMGWLLAALTTAVSVVMAATMFFSSEPEPRVTQFEILPRSGLSSMSWPMISPDGKLIAFRASDSTGTRRLYVRPLNSVEAYPLYATDNTRRPFWSPDSKYLAFFRDNRLYRIPVSGGPTQLICEASGADGSWGSSGIILFDGEVGDSIRQVPASGGVATAATVIDREAGEQGGHAWPWFLPDGDHFFYLAYSPPSAKGWFEEPTLKVGSLSGSNDKSLGILRSRIQYIAMGYVLFVKSGTLFAHRFDSDRLELVGKPIPVTTNVATFSIDSTIDRARSNFSVSNDGTLVLMTVGKEADSEPFFLVTVNWYHELDQDRP